MSNIKEKQVLGKSFSEMKQHLRTLLNVNVQEKPKSPYRTRKCKICEKDIADSYMRRHYLTVHLIEEKVHFPEKRYDCELCHRSYSQPRGLNRHLRSHPDYETFKCTICDISFMQNETFLKHLTKHQVKERHNCKTCTKSTTCSIHSSSPLLEDRKNVLYICELCNKSYYMSGSLRRHILRHHGVSPQGTNHTEAIQGVFIKKEMDSDDEDKNNTRDGILECSDAICKKDSLEQIIKTEFIKQELADELQP